MQDWTPPNQQYPPPKPGEPPAHRAARLGDHAALRELARQGIDMNEPFDIGLDPGAYPLEATPLMVAAGSGDGATVETVRLLIELGADPKLSLGGRTAAMFACEGLGWNYRPGGDAIRLKALLNAGCPLPDDPEIANRLVCAAAMAGDIERLRLLLEHGLDARGFWDAEEASRRSTDMWSRIDVFDAGREDPFAGLSDEMRDTLDSISEELREEMIEQSSSAPYRYEIPLFCAAESGNAECVRAVLEAGADPLARDDSKRTAIYCANSLEAIQLLTESGVPLEDADRYGWSPLDAAVSDGEEALPRIRALIAAGADLNATHDRGYTVFMSAVGSERSMEVMRLLVESGANPHAVSELGYNAFHAAIDINGEANREESVRETFAYLKELGVDIDRRNGAGLTPLARAIQEGTPIEVQVLCELGGDTNAVCTQTVCRTDECEASEDPLLFHAIQAWRSDAKTESLLRFGANPLATDSEGHTALARAVAEICSQAEDYEGSFRAFFVGLDEQMSPTLLSNTSMDERIAEVRSYVERFASTIPISSGSGYAEENRSEQIACIAALCAYSERA